MDELPDRLLEAAGDEPVIETVDIGGGDALIVTPARTYLYRSEGLLSDESVESFHHDVTRLAVETGRRKCSLRLESIDGERSFTVPANVADAVVEAVLEGILRTTGVVGSGESVEAQFRFSDLTLVVTDAKLFKHVGPSVWNEDFEMFDYDSLTDLDFEEGSVATQVVFEVGGRQHRVKVPNDQAGRVRREIQSAVFEHHGVSSLEGLRETVGVEADDPRSETDADTEPSLTEPAAGTGGSDASSGTDWSPPADQDVTGPRGGTRSGSGNDADAPTGEERTKASATDDGGVDAELARLADRVDELEAQLERQNETLESQTEAIEQLVEELRRGR